MPTYYLTPLNSWMNPLVFWMKEIGGFRKMINPDEIQKGFHGAGDLRNMIYPDTLRYGAGDLRSRSFGMIFNLSVRRKYGNC
jgi:hypothetical protein